MSVQSVPSHGLEQILPPVRSAGVAGDASQSAVAGQRGGATEPQDQVVVSDRARRLAEGRSGDAAKGEVELKLDFRELRALSSAAEHASASGRAGRKS